MPASPSASLADSAEATVACASVHEYTPKGAAKREQADTIADVAKSDSGLPTDPDDLTARPFEFARLEPDSPASCPHPMVEIIDYLRMEAQPDEPSESDLEFLRTASVEGSD